MHVRRKHEFTHQTYADLRITKLEMKLRRQLLICKHALDRIANGKPNPVRIAKRAMSDAEKWDAPYGQRGICTERP